jgi:hypothetical protein
MGNISGFPAGTLGSPGRIGKKEARFVRALLLGL